MGMEEPVRISDCIDRSNVENCINPYRHLLAPMADRLVHLSVSLVPQSPSYFPRSL